MSGKVPAPSPSPEVEPESAGAGADAALADTITVPGVYDIPEDEYHADPIPGGSLSSTEIKRLLDCPAKFNYWRSAGQEHKDVFDFGKAAHREVLGVGADVVVLEFDDYKTKAAQTAKKEAREAGLTPILAKEYTVVQAMTAELRRHPLAAALLASTGKPEQSLFWEGDGVTKRARLDWLPELPKSGRLIIPDYKTAPNAEKRAFAKSAADYGYHISAAWYLEGVCVVLGVKDPAFVFIVQEKNPPYVVNVVELDEYAMSIGGILCGEAVETWKRCRETGEWPGYSTDVEQVALPRWAEMQFEDTHQ